MNAQDARVLVLLSMAIGGFGCQFTHGSLAPCPDFEAAPLTPLTPPLQAAQMVFETPGTVVAYHGSGHAKLAAGQGPGIRVEQSQSIPPYADRATVILNGWRASYADPDHNVAALSTIIAKVEVTRGTEVKWNAVGLLADDNLHRAFEWTYQFTVVAWNSARLDAVADNGSAAPIGPHCTPTGDFNDNYLFADNADTTTALSSFRSFIQNQSFADSRTVAVLPRGFAFGWSDRDHNLRQVAYALDHSEILATDGLYRKGRQDVAAQPAFTSQVGAGFVSWTSSAIFKDNATRRSYHFAEMVSAIGGADVGVVQPPYSILPADDGSGWFGTCPGGGLGVISRDYVVNGVPFQYAVPVLAGWNLDFGCDDENVKEAGVWIDSWAYDAMTSTLRYRLSSVLRDRHNRGFTGTYKVMILGLRPSSGAGAGVRPPTGAALPR